VINCHAHALRVSRTFDLGELERARGSIADWSMRERTSAKGVAGNGSPRMGSPEQSPDAPIESEVSLRKGGEYARNSPGRQREMRPRTRLASVLRTECASRGPCRVVDGKAQRAIRPSTKQVDLARIHKSSSPAALIQRRL
jgi:hypothetical protein